MLSALAGIKLSGGDNNTFVQVGLVVLMGLACKNAILIVNSPASSNSRARASSNPRSKPAACAFARS